MIAFDFCSSIRVLRLGSISPCFFKSSSQLIHSFIPITSLDVWKDVVLVKPIKGDAHVEVILCSHIL